MLMNGHLEKDIVGAYSAALHHRHADATDANRGHWAPSSTVTLAATMLAADGLTPEARRAANAAAIGANTAAAKSPEAWKAAVEARYERRLAKNAQEALKIALKIDADPESPISRNTAPRPASGGGCPCRAHADPADKHFQIHIHL
jgi:hypothetical protein